MVKKIVRDPLFLQQKSEPATEADAQVIVDLMDTLKYGDALSAEDLGFPVDSDGLLMVDE